MKVTQNVNRPKCYYTTRVAPKTEGGCRGFPLRQVVEMMPGARVRRLDVLL